MPDYKVNDFVAVREAFGDTLAKLGKKIPTLIVLDGETANSTYTDKFQKQFPERFLEMFIAEQNMASVGLGLSKMGFIPVIATFAAFWTRAFDQIRMAQYSNPNLKFTGSHAGVAIGADGSSQMGLEDIAMFRSILDSIVFYPADAVSAAKLTHIMIKEPGLFYLRATRNKTPVIYDDEEEFHIGGSKVHQVRRVSKVNKEKVLIIAAGITVHEALKAQQQLAKDGIEAIVLDCYSVKPLDTDTINHLIKSTKNIIIVEDHYPAGGLGEAIFSTVNNRSEIQQYNNCIHLAVNKIPRSGTPEQLLSYEEIDAAAIVKSAKKILSIK